MACRETQHLKGIFSLLTRTEKQLRIAAGIGRPQTFPRPPLSYFKGNPPWQMSCGLFFLCHGWAGAALPPFFSDSESSAPFGKQGRVISGFAYS